VILFPQLQTNDTYPLFIDSSSPFQERFLETFSGSPKLREIIFLRKSRSEKRSKNAFLGHGMAAARNGWRERKHSCAHWDFSSAKLHRFRSRSSIAVDHRRLSLSLSLFIVKQRLGRMKKSTLENRSAVWKAADDESLKKRRTLREKTMRRACRFRYMAPRLYISGGPLSHRPESRRLGQF